MAVQWHNSHGLSLQVEHPALEAGWLPVHDGLVLDLGELGAEELGSFLVLLDLGQVRLQSTVGQDHLRGSNESWYLCAGRVQKGVPVARALALINRY